MSLKHYIKMETIKMNVFLLSDILIMIFSFTNYSSLFLAVLKIVAKFVYLFSYWLRELDQEIKDTIKIENTWHNDETVNCYRLFVFFSVYVYFGVSPWWEREALQESHGKKGWKKRIRTRSSPFFFMNSLPWGTVHRQYLRTKKCR